MYKISSYLIMMRNYATLPRQTLRKSAPSCNLATILLALKRRHMGDMGKNQKVYWRTIRSILPSFALTTLRRVERRLSLIHDMWEKNGRDGEEKEAGICWCEYLASVQERVEREEESREPRLRGGNGAYGRRVEYNTGITAEPKSFCAYSIFFSLYGGWT